MGIFFAISILILFISFLLIRKTEEKVNILKQIVTNLVLLFCYNTFICYILTLISIPITLLTLSIINLFFSILIIGYLLKTKKLQKFKFEKIDLFYISLLAIISIGVSIANFGFPLQVKYQSGDPSAHYITSQMFAKDDVLLIRTHNPDEVYGSFTTRKSASYVNSGLIMKCLANVIDEFDYYNIFICFGIFIFFLTGWMFYSTISDFAKSKKTKFFAFIFSALYLLGYPLNSLLFGFEYFSMGILIVGAIIGAVNTYQKKQIGFKLNLLIFFLLNFGVFTAYFMFVPYVYSALWIYFCIEEYKRTKKILSFKTIILLFVTLLLPFALGYIYHIEPNIYKAISLFFQRIFNTGNGEQLDNLLENLNVASSLVNRGLAGYGYMYTNFFSNMILLLPFAFITVYKKWKEDKGTILMALMNVLFIILLLIGSKFGKVSYYYLSKNYFPLWLFLFYLNFKGFLVVFEKNKWIPSICVTVYILAIILSSVLCNDSVENKIPNKHENISQLLDIYQTNKIILMNTDKDLTTDEIEVLRYVNDNIPKDKTVEVAGDLEQGFWTYAMLRRINKDIDSSGQLLLEMKMMLIHREIGKVDYLIYFNRGEYYKKLEKLLVQNTEVVFENEAGGVLKYIK